MAKLESLIEETPGIADSDLEYSQVGYRSIRTALKDAVLFLPIQTPDESHQEEGFEGREEL